MSAATPAAPQRHRGATLTAYAMVAPNLLLIGVFLLAPWSGAW